MKVLIGRLRMTVEDRAQASQAELILHLEVHRLEIQAEKEVKLHKLEIEAAKGMYALLWFPLCSRTSYR